MVASKNIFFEYDDASGSPTVATKSNKLLDDEASVSSKKSSLSLRSAFSQRSTSFSYSTSFTSSRRKPLKNAFSLRRENAAKDDSSVAKSTKSRSSTNLFRRLKSVARDDDSAAESVSVSVDTLKSSELRDKPVMMTKLDSLKLFDLDLSPAASSGSRRDGVSIVAKSIHANKECESTEDVQDAASLLPWAGSSLSLADALLTATSIATPSSVNGNSIKSCSTVVPLVKSLTADNSIQDDDDDDSAILSVETQASLTSALMDDCATNPTDFPDNYVHFKYVIQNASHFDEDEEDEESISSIQVLVQWCCCSGDYVQASEARTARAATGRNRGMRRPPRHFCRMYSAIYSVLNCYQTLHSFILLAE